MGVFQRIGNALARFMYGRNGVDQLSLVIVVGSLVLDLISMLVAPRLLWLGNVLYTVSIAAWVYALFRIASYAVASRARGRGVGEALVLHCLKTAKELGFRIMQFNAVVSNNTTALRLYAKLGFTQLGVIPGGFLMKDGSYQDIIPHYKEL